jgi:hypothetical protein
LLLDGLMAGNLWVAMGGGNGAGGTQGYLNTVWRYNMTSQHWTWCDALSLHCTLRLVSLRLAHCSFVGLRSLSQPRSDDAG